MELIIRTDVDGNLPERIEFNYEELKKELANRLAQYKIEFPVDRSNYKSCKADRARLNDLARSLNQERVNLKKRLLSPIERGTPESPSFSDKIDELIGHIRMVVGEIDEGIKAFEESEKNLKRNEITKFLNEHVAEVFVGRDTFAKSGHFARWAELQMCRRNNAWLNATCSEEFIRKEIRDEIARCANAVMLMESTYKDDDEVVRLKAENALAIDFDTAHMMQVVQSHKDEVAAIERAKIERAKQEEAALAKKVSESVPVAESKAGVSVEQPSPTIYTCTMKFVGTLDALRNLKEYLSMNSDITYKVLSGTEEVKQNN